MEIYEKFNSLKAVSSDINEHLETLYKLSLGCSHVTEMGVRGAVSTWALLAAKPRKLISYDINNCPEALSVRRAAEEEKLAYSFVQGDVLNLEVENTELLFIDTLHTYSQLSRELARHAGRVKKHIVLHDTETYGNTDESVYFPSSPQKESGKKGLKPAISDFLESEEGQMWEVESVFTNNNGLTVLRRK